MYPNAKNNYEFHTVALPLVQIICTIADNTTKSGIYREVITVIEDCTGWHLGSVLDASDDAYKDWVATQEQIKAENPPLSEDDE